MCIFYAFSIMIRFSLFSFLLTFYVPLLFSMEHSIELSKSEGYRNYGKEIKDVVFQRRFVQNRPEPKYYIPTLSDDDIRNFTQRADFQKAITRSVEFAKNKIARGKEDEELVNSIVPVRGYEYGTVGNISIVVEENKEVRDYYKKNISEARIFVDQYKKTLHEDGISEKDVYSLFVKAKLNEEESRLKPGMFSSVINSIRSAIKLTPTKEKLEQQKLYKIRQQMYENDEFSNTHLEEEKLLKLASINSLFEHLVPENKRHALRRNLIGQRTSKLDKPLINSRRLVTLKSLPQQGNGSDCGYYAVLFAWFLSQSKDLVIKDLEAFNDGLQCFKEKIEEMRKAEDEDRKKKGLEPIKRELVLEPIEVNYLKESVESIKDIFLIPDVYKLLNSTRCFIDLPTARKLGAIQKDLRNKKSSEHWGLFADLEE